MWLRKLSEAFGQRTVDGELLPFSVVREIGHIRQLETRRRQDPHILVSLVKAYERIAGRLQPSKTPIFYSTIMNNLGVTYGNLRAGQPEEYQRRSIACFEEALRYGPPETAPFERAGTLMNLGTAYFALSAGDRETNQENALGYLKQALQYWTPETTPLRVDTSLTRGVNGLGLGLTICQQIVELHEGILWAESELGEGTTFHVLLPLKRDC